MDHMKYLKAAAVIRGDGEHPQLNGVVRLFQKTDGVILEAAITGLPKSETGFFGFHIHDGGSCGGADFSNTGSHFNPARKMHPNHAGDLPPLLADHGKAYMKVFLDRFHIAEVIGKTVVIHSDPDDFHSQPSGNAGKKIGCGVIRSAQ